MTLSWKLRNYDVRKPHIYLEDGMWKVHCMRWQDEEGFRCRNWIDNLLVQQCRRALFATNKQRKE